MMHDYYVRLAVTVSLLLWTLSSARHFRLPRSEDGGGKEAIYRSRKSQELFPNPTTDHDAATSPADEVEPPRNMEENAASMAESLPAGESVTKSSDDNRKPFAGGLFTMIVGCSLFMAIILGVVIYRRFFPNPVRNSTSVVEQEEVKKEEEDFACRFCEKELEDGDSQTEHESSCGDAFKKTVEVGKELPDCCVCLEARSEMVLVPCKHICLCKSCCSTKVSKCPFCRSSIHHDVIFEVSSLELSREEPAPLQGNDLELNIQQSSVS
mmetsp:Transcript_30330/g.44604  ORF Transcript_30330/g.44604 Transcript_30330/m.44604 type:complete len:267 (-) Transcript_30330:249-1049(-)